MNYLALFIFLAARVSAQSGCDLSVPCAASGHMTMKGWKLKDKPIDQVY